MSFYSATRIGVVVPSGNAAAEPEIAHLVRRRATTHTARFPRLSDRTLRQRLETYNDVLPDVLADFGSLALDAAVVACSGSHYLLGAAQDRAFCEELGDAAGFPVASSTVATLDACADLGIDAVTLVSPYEPWLTGLSAGYWNDAGLKVRQTIPVRADDRFSPYDVTPDELVRQVEQAAPADDAVLLFTGTGMFTFDALRVLGADNNRVLLTSNVCSARWALKYSLPGGGRVGAPVEDEPWQLSRLALQAAAGRPA